MVAQRVGRSSSQVVNSICMLIVKFRELFGQNVDRQELVLERH